MRALPTLLLAAMAAAPLAAQAVEKCVSPQGKVSYVEGACPPGTSSAASIGAPAKPAAGPATAGAAGARAPAGALGAATGVARDVAVRYTQVQGRDYQSAQQWIYAHGGMHVAGEWEVTYLARTQPGAGGCRVGSFETKAAYAMTLPRWAVPDGTPAAVEAGWDRYVIKLREHEEGHIRIGRDFEAALKDTLPKMTAAGCDVLNVQLKTRYHQLLQQHQAREGRYDEDTRYGATQGAVFDVTVRRKRR